jgi:UDP-N-acetylglucosamine/UDP-N-acetylgalactosamine diphosphorylase
MAWYKQVRRQFIGDPFPLALYEGLVQTLGMAIDERVKRFVTFCEKLPSSIDRYKQQMGESTSAGLIEQKEQLYNNRYQVADLIQRHLEVIETAEHVAFHQIIEKKRSADHSDYLTTIKHLAPEERSMGTGWLQHIVKDVREEIMAVFSTIQ